MGATKSTLDPRYDKRVVDLAQTALITAVPALSHHHELADALVTPRAWEGYEGDDHAAPAAAAGGGPPQAQPQSFQQREERGAKLVAAIQRAIPGFDPVDTLERIAYGNDGVTMAGGVLHDELYRADGAEAVCNIVLQSMLRYMYYARHPDRRCDFDPLNALLPVRGPPPTADDAPHTYSAAAGAGVGSGTPPLAAVAATAPATDAFALPCRMPDGGPVYRDTLLARLGASALPFGRVLLDELPPNPPLWDRVKCDPPAGAVPDDVVSAFNAAILSDGCGLVGAVFCQRLLRERGGLSTDALIRTRALHAAVSRAAFPWRDDHEWLPTPLPVEGLVSFIHTLLNRCVLDDGCGTSVLTPPSPPPPGVTSTEAPAPFVYDRAQRHLSIRDMAAAHAAWCRRDLARVQRAAAVAAVMPPPDGAIATTKAQEDRLFGTHTARVRVADELVRRIDSTVARVCAYAMRCDAQLRTSAFAVAMGGTGTGSTRAVTEPVAVVRAYVLGADALLLLQPAARSIPSTQSPAAQAAS